MSHNFDVVTRANIFLSEQFKKVSAREKDFTQALEKSTKNILGGNPTQIILNGKELSLNEVICHSYYLGHKKQQILTFNGNLKPWNDLEVKKSLLITLEIMENLWIPIDEMSIDIAQWLRR